MKWSCIVQKGAQLTENTRSHLALGVGNSAAVSVKLKRKCGKGGNFAVGHFIDACCFFIRTFVLLAVAAVFLFTIDSVNAVATSLKAPLEGDSGTTAGGRHHHQHAAVNAAVLHEYEREEKGYCAPYNGIICKQYVSGQVWYSREDPTGGWKNEQITTALWEELIADLTGLCRQAAEVSTRTSHTIIVISLPS